jgi:hypothetical protein
MDVKGSSNGKIFNISKYIEKRSIGSSNEMPTIMPREKIMTNILLEEIKSKSKTKSKTIKKIIILINDILYILNINTRDIIYIPER